MNTQTLHSKLSADLAQEYSHQSTALHAHVALINRFGETAAKFKLTPHVRPTGGAIVLTALTARGDDPAPVLSALRKEGFHVGEPVKPVLQVNDGYVAWCVPVSGDSLTFFLLFYIEQDVA